VPYIVKWRGVEILWRDIRYALRALRKAPTFTAIAVLALALGIGANTAIFSVADAFLLKPLPLPDIEHLLVILEQAPGQTGDDASGVSMPTFRDWKRQSNVLQDLTAYEWRSTNLTGEGIPESAQAYMVEPNFFSLCGAAPLLGRTFLPEESKPGNDGVVVLSAGLWERRYGADPHVIGQTIHVDGRPLIVVGVMPRSFIFPLATDLWLPLALSEDLAARRDLHNLFVLGKPKPGETVARARIELNTLELQLAAVYPATLTGWHVMAEPIRSFAVGDDARNFTFLLLASVGCALLLVCANIANLQFVRASSRVKEIAIRVAMGGSRWRIVRQLLTESILIAFAGAGLGLFIAFWTIKIVVLNMPRDVSKTIAGWDQIHVDSRALVFAIGAAFVSGVLAGILPAMKSTRIGLSETLKESGRSNSSSRGSQRLRSLLVILQVALAVVLLGAAGLLTRVSSRISAASSGYRPESLLTMIINLPDTKYKTHPQMLSFFDPAIAKLRTIPGVQDVGATTTMPFGSIHTPVVFTIEGRPWQNASDARFAEVESISPNYLHLMGIPLIRGREFTDADSASAPDVVIISESLARAMWPNEDPIGHRMKPYGADDTKHAWMPIVGIAANVTLDWNNPGQGFIIYRSQRQWPRVYSAVVIRTSGNPESIVPEVRTAIAAVDPEQTIMSVKSMTHLVKETTISISYITMMISALGVLAVLLAAVGLYGVMAYAVSESTHEIGIRLALGATPGNVLRLVIRRGMLLTITGLLIGLPISLVWLHRVLGTFIIGIGPPNTSILLEASILLALVALLACWIPARHATRVDPLEALRYE
jgi:putative ABC transport system permease protein